MLPWFSLLVFRLVIIYAATYTIHTTMFEKIKLNKIINLKNVLFFRFEQI
jgi:hypothetical protein